MVKKINVMLVIDHLGFGGARVILTNIIKKTSSASGIYLYSLRKSMNEPTFTKEEDSRVYIYPSKFRFNLSCLFDLHGVIKKKNITVLHCHLAKSFFIGYLIKRLFSKQIKLVFHEHGKIFKNNWLYNLFLRCVKKRVDLFIAVSKATKNELMKNADINPKKIEVLYNFSDLDPSNAGKSDKQEEREKLGLRKDYFVIGFAGRLSKVKGCEHLIKSIPYINIPNFKVLIAGDGLERKNLERLTENLSITEKTIFLGYVKEILNFYGIIDVLVVPSKFESFGISVIEAQACGIPVIASNVGALNELIKNEENGLLFEFANGKDLAEKIEWMEKDKELRGRLIKNGLCTVKRYSIEEYIRSLEKNYGSFNMGVPSKIHNIQLVKIR